MFTRSYIIKFFLLSLIFFNVLPIRSVAQNSYRYSVQYTLDSYIFYNEFTFGVNIISNDKMTLKISTGLYLEEIIMELFADYQVPFITELQFYINPKKTIMLNLAVDISSGKSWGWEKYSGLYAYNYFMYEISPGVKFNLLNNRFYVLTQINAVSSFEFKIFEFNLGMGYNFNIK